MLSISPDKCNVYDKHNCEMKRCCEVLGTRGTTDKECKEICKALPASEMLHHMRECCGHAQFLDELLEGEHPEDLNSKTFHVMMSNFAVILDKEISGKPVYDRLWNCIRIIKASNWLFPPEQRLSIYLMKPLMYSISSSEMADLIACMNELPKLSNILIFEPCHISVQDEFLRNMAHVAPDNMDLAVFRLYQDVFSEEPNNGGFRCIATDKVVKRAMITIDTKMSSGKICAKAHIAYHSGIGEYGIEECDELGTQYIDFEEFCRTLDAYAEHQIVIDTGLKMLILQQSISPKSARK